MIRITLFILIGLLSSVRFGAYAQTDTTTSATQEFSLQDLEDFLFTNHPVLKQIQLLSESARASVTQALGKFDPALYADFKNKYFGEIDYYNDWSSELKVPLWLAGADLKVGYDRNVGMFTNPQSRTPNAGLSGVGISIPLGQGLLIDSRRNTLMQARAMVEYAEAEQVQQINGLWYQAISDYWDWYYAYRQFRLLQEGVRLADTRFRAISAQTTLGDRPPIDSVEAAITLQEREMQLAKYAIEFRNKKLILSNHLWNENEQPVELPEYARPTSVNISDLSPDAQLLSQLLEVAEEQHPELLMLESKGLQLNIEERYRREMLKPRLDISGTLISSRRNFSESLPPIYDFNFGNYKLGMSFAFPIFLRGERGKLREVRIQQDQLRYDQVIIGRNIRNDINTTYNDLTAYTQQLRLQVKSIANQEVLLAGELQKFELGESTLFIINSRESTLIDMQRQRENLVTAYQKALAGLYYKAGTRTTEYDTTP
ncbi:TolC family protein [Sphingobacterium sp. lm-10]|uniref:TolC family protein n=1 Tax=Sphingobacterium sp. lm-10 TaxID=2944904 RepID=UPI0020222B7C|nr:TolC family protein [Sphingobacterium sp. lm-10]MCL7989082.1 TolC family protein [Sphingobacterium sp. lm-10]